MVSQYPVKGIDWNPDVTRSAFNKQLREASELNQKAFEASQEAYAKDWEWRDQQTELLGCLIEKQDVLLEEQRKQFEAASMAERRGVALNAVMIFLMVATLIVTCISAFYAMKDDVSNTYGEDEYVDASAGDKNSEGNFAHIDPSFLDNQTIGEMSQGELWNQLDRKQHFYQSNGEME